MTREFYLLSIIPNQQTRLKLQTLRHRLFQEQGLASALAFEPVIPLAWFEGPVDSGGYARFSTGAGGSGAGRGGAVGPNKTVAESTGGGPQTPDTPLIEFGDPKLWADHLYLSVVVRPENLLQKLINAAGQAPVPAAPFPAAEGIFLAANEPEIAELTPHFSADGNLESTRIGLYSLCFGTEIHRWWEHVEWTLEWKIQLKRAE